MLTFKDCIALMFVIVGGININKLLNLTYNIILELINNKKTND